VADRRLRERLWEILDVNLRDERQAWRMDDTGDIRACPPSRAMPTRRWALTNY